MTVSVEWKMQKLGDIVDILDSRRIPVNETERRQRIGTIPYYGATGRVGWIDQWLFDEELVLLGEDGAPFLDRIKDKAYLIRGRSWVNNHAHVLRASAKLAENRFLKHYLNYFDYTDYVNGTTRLKLTQAAMREIPIRLPTVDEQCRVSDNLDHIAAHLDGIKARLETIPSILKRFRMSVLATACSGRLTEDWRKMKNLPVDTAEHWEECSFGELVADGPQNGLYKPASAYGSGAMILRIDSFYDGQITDWAKLKRLRLSKEEQENFALANGDIVVNRVNSMPYLGKSALVRNLPKPCVFESNMMRIRLDRSRVEPEYAIRYLNSPQGLVELRKNAKQAVNQASINQQDVMAVAMALPPLEEQVEIIRRAEGMFKQADAIEARYRKAHVFTDKLMPSVLAKAFRGEL